MDTAPRHVAPHQIERVRPPQRFRGRLLCRAVQSATCLTLPDSLCFVASEVTGEHSTKGSRAQIRSSSCPTKVP